MKKIFSVYILAFVAVILVIATAVTGSVIGVNHTKKTQTEQACSAIAELTSRENIDDLVLTIYVLFSDPFLYRAPHYATKEYVIEYGEKTVLKGEEIRPILESYKQLTPEQLVPVYPESRQYSVKLYYSFETEEEGEILGVAFAMSDVYSSENDTETKQHYFIINDVCFEDHFNQFAQ